MIVNSTFNGGKWSFHWLPLLPYAGGIILNTAIELELLLTNTVYKRIV